MEAGLSLKYEILSAPFTMRMPALGHKTLSADCALPRSSAEMLDEPCFAASESTYLAEVTQSLQQQHASKIGSPLSCLSTSPHAPTVY